MNGEEAVHTSDNIVDYDYSNIDCHETHHNQTNQNNCFCTHVDNKLQSSPQLEDLKGTYD